MPERAAASAGMPARNVRFGLGFEAVSGTLADTVWSETFRMGHTCHDGER